MRLFLFLLVGKLYVGVQLNFFSHCQSSRFAITIRVYAEIVAIDDTVYLKACTANAKTIFCLPTEFYIQFHILAYPFDYEFARQLVIIAILVRKILGPEYDIGKFICIKKIW